MLTLLHIVPRSYKMSLVTLKSILSLMVQGANKKIDPQPDQFAPFQTIFQVILRILTVTGAYLAWVPGTHVLS